MLSVSTIFPVASRLNSRIVVEFTRSTLAFFARSSPVMGYWLPSNFALNPSLPCLITYSPSVMETRTGGTPDFVKSTYHLPAIRVVLEFFSLWISAAKIVTIVRVANRRPVIGLDVSFATVALLSCNNLLPEGDVLPIRVARLYHTHNKFKINVVIFAPHVPIPAFRDGLFVGSATKKLILGSAYPLISTSRT